MALLLFGHFTMALAQQESPAELAYLGMAKEFSALVERARNDNDYQAASTRIAKFSAEYPEAKRQVARLNCMVAASHFPAPDLSINHRRLNAIPASDLLKVERVCAEGIETYPDSGAPRPSDAHRKVIVILCLIHKADCGALRPLRSDPPNTRVGGYHGTIGPFNVTPESAQRSASYTNVEALEIERLDKQTRPLFIEASRMRRAGKHAEAVEVLTQLLQLNPYEGSYFRMRASSFMALKQFVRAEQDFTTAISLSDKSSELVGQRAKALWLQGKSAFDRALIDYNQAVLWAPTDSRWVGWRGQLLHEMGRQAEGDTDVRKAIALDTLPSRFQSSKQGPDLFVDGLVVLRSKEAHIDWSTKDRGDGNTYAHWVQSTYESSAEGLSSTVLYQEGNWPTVLEPSITLCNKSTPQLCRAVQFSSPTNSNNFVKPTRYLNSSPAIKIYRTPSLDDISTTIPTVSYGRYIGEAEIVGVWGKNHLPFESTIQVIIDDTFDHPRAARLIAIGRFINGSGYEPIVGYVAKSSVTAPNEGYREVESPELKTVYASADEAVSRLARLPSPFNAIDLGMDPRRVYSSTPKGLLKSFGFVSVVNEERGTACSAALVGNSKTIITAGHCVGANGSVVVQYLDGRGNAHKRSALVVENPHALRAGSTSEIPAMLGVKPDQQKALAVLSDWAVLRLDSAFPDEAIPLQPVDLGRYLSPVSPSPVYVVGFPGDVPLKTPTLSVCTPPLNSSNRVVAWSSNTVNSMMLGLRNCISFSGNSGGPVLVIQDGELKFLGVVAASKSDFLFGCYSFHFDNLGDLTQIASRRYLTKEQGDEIFKFAKANGGHWPWRMIDLKEVFPALYEYSMRASSIALSLPILNSSPPRADSSEEREKCTFRPYWAPFKHYQEVNITSGTLLFERIAKESNRRVITTPAIGKTVFSLPRESRLVTSRGKGLFEFVNGTAERCLKYLSRRELTPGARFVDEPTDCVLDASVLEKALNLGRGHDYQLVLRQGTLIVLRKSDSKLLRSYEGVMQACIANPLRNCHLQDAW